MFYQYFSLLNDISSKSFNNLLSTRPITELLSPEQYKEYEEEVKAAPPPPSEGTEEQSIEKSGEKVDI